MWSGTWKQLFSDPSVFTGRAGFSGVTISGNLKDTFRQRRNEAIMACETPIVDDPAAVPSFMASYDSSAGKLSVQVDAPTFRGSRHAKPQSDCFGGPGTDVLSPPGDSPLGGGGGTVDLDQGGTVRYDKDWRWTHTFPADLDGARREYAAEMRSELVVSLRSCGQAAAASCDPRVWSVTFSKTPWTRGAEFTNGAALLVDRRAQEPLAVSRAEPSCPGRKLAVWLDCPAFPDGVPERTWPVAFTAGSTPTIAEVRFKLSPSCAPLGAVTLRGTAEVPGGGPITFEKTGLDQKQCGDFVVKGLTGKGTLPKAVRRIDAFAIDWTFLDRKGEKHTAGTSKHLVYLLLGRPTLPALAAAARGPRRLRRGSSRWAITPSFAIRLVREAESTIPPTAPTIRRSRLGCVRLSPSGHASGERGETAAAIPERTAGSSRAASCRS